MEGLNELDMSKIELVASEEHEYRCPFCDEVMPKRKMQFHVAIPLCMRIREEKTPSVVIEGAHPALQTNVPKIDLEYYGPMGIRNLLSYMIQRTTFGHPDRGKPVDLESFVDHSEVTAETIEERDVRLAKESLKEKLARVYKMLRNVVTDTTVDEKEEYDISGSLFIEEAEKGSPFEKDERREKYFDNAEEDESEENDTRDN